MTCKWAEPIGSRIKERLPIRSRLKKKTLRYCLYKDKDNRGTGTTSPSLSFKNIPS